MEIIGENMDIFEKKPVSEKQLSLLSQIAKKMQSLNLGNGRKKDASASKVKDPNKKEEILHQRDYLLHVVEKQNISILAFLEAARVLKHNYDNLAREKLPPLFNEMGVREQTLQTGEKLVLEDVIESSIPDKNSFLVHVNMIAEQKAFMVENLKKERGVDSLPEEDLLRLQKSAEDIVSKLFSKKIVIEEPTEDLKQLLLDNNILYDNKLNIAWQTLRSYCKRQRASGRPIPDGISVFEYSEVKIK